MAKPDFPLYHISPNPALPSKLFPKQPDSAFLQNDLKNGMKKKGPPMDPFNRNPEQIYLERLPPRTCFAPTMEGCFIGIWTNYRKQFEEYQYPWLELFVYQLTEFEDGKMVTAEEIQENRQVWDAVFSDEHYFTGWCKVKRIGKIRIHRPSPSEWVEVRPFLDERYPFKAIPKPRIEVITSYSPEAKKIKLYRDK